MTPEEREQAVERERVAQVFGLTGGEMADERWIYVTASCYSDGTPQGDGPDDFRTWSQLYWYEGVPEYVDGARQKNSGDGTWRTLVEWGGGLMPYPPKELYDGQGIWKFVELFNSSGECECPGRHKDQSEGGNTVTAEETSTGEKCVLCEEKLGEEHKYIYIGEGYEAVYKLSPHLNLDEDQKLFLHALRAAYLAAPENTGCEDTLREMLDQVCEEHGVDVEKLIEEHKLEGI